MYLCVLISINSVTLLTQVLNTLTSSVELIDLVKNVDTVFHSKPSGSSKSVLNSLYRFVPIIREQLQVFSHLYVFFVFFIRYNSYLRKRDCEFMPEIIGGVRVRLIESWKTVENTTNFLTHHPKIFISWKAQNVLVCFTNHSF